MKDHLAVLAASAKARVGRGYYDDTVSSTHSTRSLRETIESCKTTPIIAEVKFRSPSAGRIREFKDRLEVAKAMTNGGASAVSILTDPDNFAGELEFLDIAKRELRVPIVMKDVIVSPVQLQAGSRAGADAVVLISELFTRGLTETRLSQMMLDARKLGLETLVEANSVEDFATIRDCKPDLYGINNRNLSTLEVDLETTPRILEKNKDLDRPVVSESGIESPSDIGQLRAAGASAFLVGTSIMKSPDIESKVRELANA